MAENFYLEDILSQDAELTQALDFYGYSQFQKRLNALGQLNASKVVFSGMGSSHYCSYGADILLKQHGITSQVISTGELIYYEKDFLDKDTVLCLISQSGESAETRHLLEKVDEKVFVIAVTNQAESTLGKRGNVCFTLNVSDEISVTTRTYVSSLVLTQLIATALCNEDTKPVFEEYKKTIARVGCYLKNYREGAAQMREFCGKMHVISLIGRGNTMSTVRAGALFLREVSKFPTMDFDSAEFRHGPMEMVQEGFRAMVFAPAGKTQDLEVKMAQDIAEKGGKVILVTDESGKKAIGQESENILPVVLPEVEEYACQILVVLPVQLLANELAEAAGIPAGVFRWGSKIMQVE